MSYVASTPSEGEVDPAGELRQLRRELRVAALLMKLRKALEVLLRFRLDILSKTYELDAEVVPRCFRIPGGKHMAQHRCQVLREVAYIEKWTNTCRLGEVILILEGRDAIDQVVDDCGSFMGFKMLDLISAEERAAMSEYLR